MYKNSKWARNIIDLQHDDGSWGCFHSLSQSSESPITTEQALRRLSILGYNFGDEPIQKTVKYMSDCLSGAKQIPDRQEKLHNWDIFTKLMLSTWICKFTKENDTANKIADSWSAIISSAFTDNVYDHSEYIKAYNDVFGMKPRGGRLTDFVSFYQVSLIADKLDPEKENMVFDYILNHNNGIYYVYGDVPLSVVPAIFQSKQSSCYLGAIELLSAYKRNLSKLKFVSDWLISCQNKNGKWDMGSKVNDKVNFPLSDSWRRKETREADCTYRVQKLLAVLNTTTPS